ncbi:hypothetical protein KDA_25630 [Dictyobacter alpinus]|uniref:General stress protein 17M-like domain-containing protein n=1 Tax=Dictyobacter alpinus TaxID=2014873 RepID=A0A402B6X8_9CHLR|nr:hypothetical protein [Dictyobacter alpinus]GCE27079.1 hypothetical protein KDA_25630 [Dictyobacter alpinus]
MTPVERTTAVGVFSEQALAEQAMSQLQRAGFTDEQIGFIVRSPQSDGAMADDSGTAGASAATGAVSGGVIGGILGAVTSLLIPGIGPVIATGILVTTLGGIALGALAGGLAGSLMHLGVPEHEARYYEDQLNSGRSIITVNAPGRYEEALSILRQTGAYDAEVRNDAPDTDTYVADNNAATSEPVVYPAGLAGISGPDGTINPGLPPAAAFPVAPVASTNELSGRSLDEPVYSPEEVTTTKQNLSELRAENRRLAEEQRSDSTQQASDPYADPENDDTVVMPAARRPQTATADARTATTAPDVYGPVPAPARSAFTNTPDTYAAQRQPTEDYTTDPYNNNR